MRRSACASSGGPEQLRLEEVSWIHNQDPISWSWRCEPCGVNPVDTYIRTAHMRANSDLAPPYTPGSDGAGVVAGKR
jgi:NADPH:quinone reductase-like Zn-dependent oxidoreductase